MNSIDIRRMTFLLMCTLMGASGCGIFRSHKVLRYKQVQSVIGKAVAVKLLKGKAERGAVDLVFEFTNLSDQKIVFNRNQFVLVAPSKDYVRHGTNNIFTIRPNKKRKLRLVVKARRVAFNKAPGIYVRFDGFYFLGGEHAGKRMDIPPMALGKPSRSPGIARADFIAPKSNQLRSGGLLGNLQRLLADRSSDRAKARAARKAKRGNAAAQSMPEASTTSVTSSGDTTALVQVSAAPSNAVQQTGAAPEQVIRYRLANPGIRCAGMALKPIKFDAEIASLMDEILLGELQDAGFDAIGNEDINAMIGLEQSKDAVGCDEASCMAEIGGALGVDYMVTGTIGTIKDAIIVNLKLIDVKNSRVLARANSMGDESIRGIPDLLARGVAKLVVKSKL